MSETQAIVTVLSLIAPMFSYMGEKDYGNVSQNAAWEDVRRAALGLARNDAERASFVRATTLPPWPVRSTLQNNVLLPGMPLAELPVESLYKPWSAAPGNAYGAQRGLYLGDAARHLQSVYAKLELEVPERFAAMPDHLSLTLDLLALFAENGSEQAARDLVRDHFDWLDDYDAALAARAEQAVAQPAFDDAHRAALAEGIAHLRALVALAGRAAEAAVQCDSEQRDCREISAPPFSTG